MAADLEHRDPGDTIRSDLQFSLIAGHFSPTADSRHLSLHTHAGGLGEGMGLCLKLHQGRDHRKQAVAKRTGKLISASVRAKGSSRSAPCSQDHPVCQELFPGTADDKTIFCVLDLIHMDPGVYLDPPPLQFQLHKDAHGGRLVGSRIDIAIPGLCLQSKSMEKGKGFLQTEGIQYDGGLLQILAVKMGETHLFIGKITSAISGREDLPARQVVVFQQEDLTWILFFFCRSGSGDGGSHSGRSRPNDGDLLHIPSPPFAIQNLG